MTSLMDVMFLVLVFFIYCIFDMAVHKGLQVDLPQARHSGLIGAQRILKDVPGIAFVELDERDIIRHKLVTRIVQAYAREEEAQRARHADGADNQTEQS